MSDDVNRASPWKPAIGDRVVLVRTGQTGTVLRLAPTEWGLLCDLELDPLPGVPPPGAPLPGSRQPAAAEEPARRVHASTELAPLDR